ncbi:hypothetical protein [Proteus cibi]|uniref:hypothetical protein n=1 Tax=Proteus cibi TaxID=2050966 RepID=UPI0035A5A5A3
MQGTNSTRFEKLCAKEMGHIVEYMIMQRKINIFGGLEYKHDEVNVRFKAYNVGMINGLSTAFEEQDNPGS